MLRRHRRAPDPRTLSFLEAVQRDLTGGIPWAERGFPDLLSGLPAAVGAFVNDTGRLIRPATRYENPALHWMLQTLAIRIDEQVATTYRGPQVGKPPVFGLMQTSRVNARAVYLPESGEYIILVAEELFTFLSLMAEAVALALPVERTLVKGKELLAVSWAAAAIQRRIAGNSDALVRTADVVLAYVVAGRASAAKPYSIAEPHARVAEILRDASELFVVAHEYAHVMEGHLRRGLPASGHLAPTLLSLTDEALADGRAVLLAGHALERAGNGIYWGFLGAELFLYANEILLKAIGILRTGNARGLTKDESYQHASFDTRRRAVGTVLRDQVAKVARRANSAEAATSVNELLGMVRLVLDELWTHLQPMLLRAHRRGTRPSEAWTE